MKNRCLNSKGAKYKYWGGRGIKICDRWLGVDGFINFLEDMGRKPSPSHSIDRYPDKDGFATEVILFGLNIMEERWLLHYGQKS